MIEGAINFSPNTQCTSFNFHLRGQKYFLRSIAPPPPHRGHHLAVHQSLAAALLLLIPWVLSYGTALARSSIFCLPIPSLALFASIPPSALSHITPHIHASQTHIHNAPLQIVVNLHLDIYRHTSSCKRVFSILTDVTLPESTGTCVSPNYAMQWRLTSVFLLFHLPAFQFAHKRNNLKEFFVKKDKNIRRVKMHY